MDSITTTLLLVEDNLGDAGLIQAALGEASTTSHEFRPVHVERLSQALDLLKTRAFDLVLLDLSLPDSNGIKTVSRISEAAPAVPIVIMTGLDDQDVALEAMRKGAQDFLVKGQVDGDMLARAIRYAIERKRQLERQTVLTAINQAITSTLDLNAVLNVLLDKIIDSRPTDAAYIRLLNSETEEMEPVACRNLDEVDWKKTLSTIHQGLAYAVMSEKKPVAILDVCNDSRCRDTGFHRRNRLVSYLGLPLIVDDVFLGVLAVYTRQRHEFGPGEMEFFNALASQASLAIRNSRLYEKLKRSNETLEKTLEIKSVLTGIMAHELKTPLQLIMGAAGMLSAGMCGALSEEQHKRVETIEAGADELLQLIDSSLEMARLEQGKVHLMVTEIRPGDLLAELKTEFVEGFRKKGVELNMAIPPPGLTLKSDRIKVKEILRNLIDNARKFTRAGQVSVEFATKERDRVEFVVSDTGAGIKSDLLPKIFELFYQVDPRQKEHGGAGLGLNIVKRLVTALSGEITVESEIGRGTTFRVVLPKEIADSTFISS